MKTETYGDMVKRITKSAEDWRPGHEGPPDQPRSDFIHDEVTRTVGYPSNREEIRANSDSYDEGSGFHMGGRDRDCKRAHSALLSDVYRRLEERRVLTESAGRR